MTDVSTFDGTVDLSGGDVTLGGLLALFGAVGGFDANYRWEQVRE